MSDLTHRRLGKCVEIYPTDQGWAARQYDPEVEQQTLHGGFQTKEAAMAQYGGDPDWPMFVLDKPPSDAVAQ